jgi:cytoskeletal protein RodZ
MAVAEASKSDFGTRMKRSREGRGVSLRQIAEATKISVVALEALERNEIARLPGGIFSRSFVRSYALEVGLDPEQTVRDFLVHFPEDSVTVGSPHVRRNDLDDRPRRRGGATVVLVLLVISALFGAAAYFALSLR